jgi:hypothetical protein
MEVKTRRGGTNATNNPNTMAQSIQTFLSKTFPSVCISTSFLSTTLPLYLPFRPSYPTESSGLPFAFDLTHKTHTNTHNVPPSPPSTSKHVIDRNAIENDTDQASVRRGNPPACTVGHPRCQNRHRGAASRSVNDRRKNLRNHARACRPEDDQVQKPRPYVLTSVAFGAPPAASAAPG